MTSAVAWVAAATTALHLATANLWGYHRDEFYYLACGRRLAWGFVDHPPVTPWLYRLADLTLGTSKLGLRTVPALLHGATVLLIAALAASSAARPRAQLLAALAAALAPLLLTTGHFLGTVTVEITVGAAVALVAGTAGRRRRPPPVARSPGVLAGIGLLNKWTFAFGDRRARGSACCSATVTSSARRGCSPAPRSPSPSGRPTSGGRPSTAGRSSSSRARCATTGRPRSWCPHS